jgi:hypothetical protein
MQKSWKILILTFVGILTVVLLTFGFIKFVRHLYWNSHLVKFPSVIPIQAWKKFSSDEGGFSIWFPGNPIETNELVETAQGEMSQRIFYVDADRQTGYTASFCENSAFSKIIQAGKLQSFFDESQTAIAAEHKGKIIFQEETKWENSMVREFEYEAGGNANFSVRVRLILSDARLYELCTIFLTANSHPEDREYFFRSFSLLKHASEHN